MIMNSCLVVNESTSLKEQTSFNPLQFTIDLHRADQAMFEAVINLDLMDAFNESGVISVSESEMEMQLEAASGGIWQKIKSLISKAKTAIMNFVKKIADKFQTIFDKDKRMFKKYGKAFNEIVNNARSSAASGPGVSANDIKSGTGEYEIPNYQVIDNIINNGDKQLGKLNYSKVVGAINMVRDENEFSKKVEEFNKVCEQVTKEFDELGDKLTVKKSNTALVTALGEEGISRIRDNIQKGKANRINRIKIVMNTQLKELDNAEKNAKIDQSEGGHGYDTYLDKNAKKDQAGSAAKYNAIFSVISASQKVVSRAMNLQLAAIKKEYSLERKYFMQLVRANKKNDKVHPDLKKDEKEEAKNEATYRIWAVGECSDIYMEQTYAELGI